jgi:ribose transport system ATP-binding protein
MSIERSGAMLRKERGASQTAQRLVTIDSVSKRYGLATVLDAVSFDVRRGEVHAVVGENGAGKSTLARILSGFVAPNDGTVRIDGEVVTRFSVRDAERLGVVLIHQELALAEHLNVADNMFLGHELHRGFVLSRKKMSLRSREMLNRLGCSVSPLQTVSSLPVSDKQMVEIAKALLRDAKLIIMDEPTAVLTPREAANLFIQIETLRNQGVAIIYVSHKLDEVKRIADRVTVLRDGKYQGTWAIGSVTEQDIANLMVGRELSLIYPAKATPGPRVEGLEVRNFLGETSQAPASFHLRSGEIFGVAGLVGSGRTELFESMVGLRSRRGGDLRLRGSAFEAVAYRDALLAGVVYITEDRKGRGLLLAEAIGLNVSLLDQILSGSRLVDLDKERRARDRAIREFGIEAPDRDVQVGRLSGGNQQKVLLAKSLLNKPALVVVDEPTRGIDVGTRAQIYEKLRRLAAGGVAVVIISSDMQEVIGLSDRVMVMRDNAIAGFLEGSAITEAKIVQLATGVAERPTGEA